jgi:hypothetical protein
MAEHGRAARRRSACERPGASLEEGVFGRALGQREGCLVVPYGLGVAAEAAQQVGADRVEDVVAVEAEAVQQVEGRPRALDSATATARLRATTGLGARAMSWS